MATSVSYTGDGVTTNYSLPFTYLSPDYIKASINNVETLDFTLFNQTTVSFNSAPADGAAIRIFRETPTDNLLAEANPGSALRAQDLELNARQNLNVVQELETFVNNQSSAGLQAQVDAANTNAANAVTTAAAANTAANNATITANSIAGTANTALTNANTAVTTANSAVSTANAASTNVTTAQNTANTALTNANNAQTTADTGLALAQVIEDRPQNRNLIQNGGFDVNEIRGFGVFTPSGANPGLADRWRGDNSTGNNLSYQTITSGGPLPAVPQFLRVTVATARASLTSAEYYSIYQVVEGYNTRRLGWGTASAIPAVLSFRVRASTTGTYCVSIQNATKDRSYLATFTIGATNNWEYKTISIPAITTGSWNTANGRGVQVRFTLATGTSFQGTNNTWNTVNRFGTSTQSNLLASAGRTFDVTATQLEPGTVATDFELLNIDDITKQCLRYYYKMPGQLGFNGTATANGSTTSSLVNFPVPMRDVASSFNSAFSSINLSSLTIDRVTDRTARVLLTASAAGNYNCTFDSNGSIGFDAEYLA